jgi:hypothetical protein
MFGFRTNAKASMVADAQATANVSALRPDGGINDTATHAMISFPVPWTSRTMSPIKRPKADKMWGNEIPESYGGPWK